MDQGKQLSFGSLFRKLRCFCTLRDTQRWTCKGAHGAVCRTRRTGIIDRPLAKSLIIPPLCDPCTDMEGNKQIGNLAKIDC